LWESCTELLLASPIFSFYLANFPLCFKKSSTLTVNEPIKVVSHKLGLNAVDPEGKESVTHFLRVAYDALENKSLVLARPVTGRTHQIRVHLQHLGHPISNDPLYNNPFHPHVLKMEGKRGPLPDSMGTPDTAPPETCAEACSMEIADGAPPENINTDILVEVSANPKAFEKWIGNIANSKTTSDSWVTGQCSECGTECV
jgi:hypothetical protein